jgi:pyruvate/2-oxoglutarate dehydrogenase complex dihydrolipoamide dehydrogenase (E3) component
MIRSRHTKRKNFVAQNQGPYFETIKLLCTMKRIVEVAADKKYGEVLGIHFIGEGASEMAEVGGLALQMEDILEDLAGASFPHPPFPPLSKGGWGVSYLHRTAAIMRGAPFF